ncbi:MAG: magnesium transporter [Nitrososphaerales archaeon]
MAATGERKDLAKEYLERYGGLKPILAQILPILLLTLAGSILAGFLFLTMKELLELLPGLLAMIPAVMDTRGGVFGAFGSKIATGLHLGIVEPRFVSNRNVNNAIAAALINSIVISIAIAVIAYAVLLLLGLETIPVWALAVITLLAGTISGLILVGVVMFITFTGFRRGVDPDNLVGPVVTVTGDIFSIFALLFSAKIILVILT